MVTVDIPGAFTQGNHKETVHMWLEGVVAKLLIKCNHNLYCPYVTQENIRDVLYVELIKALYGTLQAIFLCKLTANFIEWDSRSIPMTGE